MTVRVPENATELFTVEAVTKASDSVVAKTTATVSPCQSTTAAIDSDGDGKIGDFEVLDAIEYWRTGAEVPGTCGQTIGDFEVLDIIGLWRDGESV